LDHPRSGEAARPAAHARRRLGILAFAFALRLGAIAWSGPGAVTFGDGLDYLATARYVCEEHSYPDRGSLPFFRAPLLPAFISAVTICHPERVAAVKVGLALCDSITAVLVGEIAFTLFASSAAAGLAALLAALNPFFLAGVCDIRTEPLAMLFLTAAFWLFLGAVRSLRLAEGVLSGAALAMSSLARPAGLAALLLTVATAFAVPWPRSRRWRLPAAVAFGAFAVLLPWIARNAIRYRELIVVNDAAGFNFWRGTNPEIGRIAEIDDPAEYRKATEGFETTSTIEAARPIEAGAAGPRERSRAWFAAGLANVKRAPGLALGFALRRALSFWRPWLNPQEHSMKVVVASAALNTALYALAAIGLWRRRRNDRFVVGWVVTLFFGVLLAHVPYQVVMRFRIPFTDPLLIALASGTIVRGFETARAPRRAERGPMRPV